MEEAKPDRMGVRGVLQSNKPLRELRETAKKITKQLPGPLPEITSKVDEYARGMISGCVPPEACCFGEMG